ncbi:Thrombospondin type-1 domain-containing protein 4 [Eumeta japonica]|uniref:Thrombospondin type-1 domain-containing protein 4 n=1 Tax=Eumeta variegata TaxID=151549 RepID=A0A4C1T8A8_EUMVA|nr:Thrombospondin type-1 domain-containing protein 4 [Eumeta japonica]
MQTQNHLVDIIIASKLRKDEVAPQPKEKKNGLQLREDAEEDARRSQRPRLPRPGQALSRVQHCPVDSCRCRLQACPGPVREPRAAQCALYDRRPFRGRFYTWVPYVDDQLVQPQDVSGNSPCTLNCRPRGQHFYASLALVEDGTPCTRPGFRAICVQGSCKDIDKMLARKWGVVFPDGKSAAPGYRVTAASSGGVSADPSKRLANHR